MSCRSYLQSIIEAQGPLNMAQFMAVTLSDPQHGYYMSTQPLGAKGDFITAPEISQMFGEMAGIWCASVWEVMGRPDDVAIVELGPGRGTLLCDLLQGTRNIRQFHDSISLHLVEISPSLKKEQQKNLMDAPVAVAWHDTFDTVPARPTLLLANEFFDALPVHQFVRTKDGWREKLVALDDKKHLVFQLSPVETPACALIGHEYRNAPEGSVYEACPAAVAIADDIARHIGEYGGATLMIDYGYDQPPLVESLQAVKAHGFHDPLATPGEADITAHVHFRPLLETARRAGLRAFGPVTQGVFLKAMGIELRAAMLLRHATDEQRAVIVSEVERLVQEKQMGELFKCIAFTHPSIMAVAGFEDDNQFRTY